MKRWEAALAAAAVLATGCGGGDGKGRIVFTLEVQGLRDLGPDRGTYEGWAVVGGFPRSTGKFVVDESTVPPRLLDPRRVVAYGPVTGATFGPSITGLGQDFPFIQDATAFFVTIEPEGDEDGVPSGNVLLEGTFIGDEALLAAEPGLVLGTGSLALATGTAVVTGATSAPPLPAGGVWFLGSAPPPEVPGLAALPALSGAWTYEGFLVEPGGAFFSTGKLTAPDRIDLDAQATPGRGTAGVGFDVPGQDFVTPYVVGAAVRQDLVTSGTWQVEVTVEPWPDNAAAPFPLRILEGPIPADAVAATGVAAGPVGLMPLAGALPVVVVTGDGTRADFAGSGFEALGPPAAGEYALFAASGFAPPVLIARFVVDPGSGAVTTPDGAVVLGNQAGWSVDAASADPAALALLPGASEAFIAQLPQGGPRPGFEPVPFLAGEVAVTPGGIAATLTVDAAIADFSAANGLFVCRTPTNDASGVPADDAFGVWFRELSRDEPGLELPELPPRWRYEGWVVDTMSGTRYSTGTFARPEGPDDDAMVWTGRGPESVGFPFPGQDFLVDDPGTMVPALAVAPPLELLVTIEPFPDNAREPFFLEVLRGPVAGAGVSFPLAGVFGAPGGALVPAGRVTFDD